MRDVQQLNNLAELEALSAPLKGKSQLTTASLQRGTAKSDWLLESCTAPGGVQVLFCGSVDETQVHGLNLQLLHRLQLLPLRPCSDDPQRHGTI